MKFNIEDIDKISKKIVKYLESINLNNSTVLALYGNLGAGKTTITQSISKVLGISEVVNSPTFVIQKRYKINNDKYNNLIHIDSYRISNIEEVKVLGLEEEMKEKTNIIIIEWPENIKEVIPSDCIEIHLNHVGEENFRDIKIINNGEDITTILEECRE